MKKTGSKKSRDTVPLRLELELVGELDLFIENDNQ
jgi:hypothetical protein